MNDFEEQLAKRIRERMPELAYGQVDTVFDNQLADIIRECIKEQNECSRKHTGRILPHN